MFGTKCTILVLTNSRRGSSLVTNIISRLILKHQVQEEHQAFFGFGAP